MNKFVTMLAGFVGGAIAGAYATKKYYRTKCEMEITAMRELCDRTTKEANQRAEKAQDEANKATEDRQIFAEALTRLGYTNREPQTATNHIQEEPKGESEPIDRAELEFPTENDTIPPFEIELQRKRQPELISEQVYSEDIYGGFEKKEVLWYPADEVLLDGDTNELMDDPYSFLGTDWKPIIERDGEAYVRNYRWEVDYLILMCEGLGADNMSLEN